MNKISVEIMELMKKSFGLTNLKGYCRANYSSGVKKFLQHSEGGFKKVEELNLQHVKDFLSYMLNERKLKIGTVNNYRSAIKYLFEIVLEKKWCDKQIPFLSGYKTLPTALSKQSAMAVVKASENLLYATLFLTIYSSGLRITEALNLKISDIDVSMVQINVRKSKNGSSRKAILSHRNLDALRNYFKHWWIKKFGKYEREDYLFCLSKKNTQISYTTASKAFTRAVKVSGVNPNASVHSLRHGFAIFLMEKGASIGAIKELLGHSSLKSTLIYTKLANYSVMGIKSPLDYDDDNGEDKED